MSSQVLALPTRAFPGGHASTQGQLYSLKILNSLQFSTLWARIQQLKKNHLAQRVENCRQFKILREYNCPLVEACPPGKANVIPYQDFGPLCLPKLVRDIGTTVPYLPICLCSGPCLPRRHGTQLCLKIQSTPG